MTTMTIPVPGLHKAMELLNRKGHPLQDQLSIWYIY